MEISELIKVLELELLNPAIRNSKERLNELLADDFYEIGESGKQYNKQEIINILPTLSDIKYSVQNFNAIEIADDMVLATYQIQKDNISSGDRTFSLRSSIWQNRNGNWQIIFHQGTRLIQ